MDIRTETETTPETMETIAERKAEREDQKKRNAVQDILYASKNVQSLLILDRDLLADPQISKALSDLRNNIDAAVQKTSQETETPAENEAALDEETMEEDTGTGPLDEQKARLEVEAVGFGRPKYRNSGM